MAILLSQRVRSITSLDKDLLAFVSTSFLDIFDLVTFIVHDNEPAADSFLRKTNTFLNKMFPLQDITYFLRFPIN